MNKELNEQQFVNAVRQSLTRCVEELEPGILVRLDKVRAQALSMQFSGSETERSIDSLFMSTQTLLDDSVLDLDPSTNEHLDKIRISALRKASKANTQHTKTTLDSIRVKFSQFLRSNELAVPISAFATACILVSAFLLTYLSPAGPRFSLDDGDILLLASSDEIELYENLEFYQWLADNGMPQ